MQAIIAMEARVFQYDFMQHALIAVLLAALIGGIVGYLILMRRLAFAAHGLGHVSFTGATLALLLNISPMIGQFFATLSAGFLIGLLGESLQKRDVAIAMTLSLMLGLGMLFLHYYVGSANTATSLLFGDILGVSPTEIKWMAWLTVITLIILGFILRPLILCSIAPQLAQAKNLPSKTLGIVFMLLVATSVTLVNQIVGALLVFILLIGPAAISQSLTRSFWTGMGLSIFIAMTSSALALVISFYSNLPVSVCLTGIIVLLYGLKVLINKNKI
jgi:zinc/manganese transport system permease protein